MTMAWTESEIADRKAAGLPVYFDSTKIEIDGVGVVGSSVAIEDMCESCKTKNCLECSGFTLNGDACECICQWMR